MPKIHMLVALVIILAGTVPMTAKSYSGTVANPAENVAIASPDKYYLVIDNGTLLQIRARHTEGTHFDVAYYVLKPSRFDFERGFRKGDIFGTGKYDSWLSMLTMSPVVFGPSSDEAKRYSQCLDKFSKPRMSAHTFNFRAYSKQKEDKSYYKDVWSVISEGRSCAITRVDWHRCRSFECLEYNDTPEYRAPTDAFITTNLQYAVEQLDSFPPKAKYFNTGHIGKAYNIPGRSTSYEKMQKQFQERWQKSIDDFVIDQF